MTLVKERKREREGREKYDATTRIMIQRLRLTFVFKKMVNVATNGAFFPRASLLNTIVQQVESPARESMDTSVVDVIATCKCVRFYNVFLRGEKKNSARFDNANNRASFAYQLRSSSLSYPRTSELLPYPIE